MSDATISDATIKVNLNNAKVVLYGKNFQDALGFVKSFQGRSFDGQLKFWNVPVSLKAFSQKASSNGMQVEEMESSKESRGREEIRDFNPFKKGTEDHQRCAGAAATEIAKKLGWIA